MTTSPSSSSGVPAEYLPLYKYLLGRYAQAVVLTLGQIEDLVGFSLPDLARKGPEWWANADANHPPSPQSRAWMQADRLATPRLQAGIVTFEHVADARP